MSTKLSSQQLHIHLTFIRDGVPLRVSACSGLTPFDSLLDFYYKNIRNYQVKENQSLTASLAATRSQVWTNSSFISSGGAEVLHSSPHNNPFFTPSLSSAHAGDRNSSSRAFSPAKRAPSPRLRIVPSSSRPDVVGGVQTLHAAPHKPPCLLTFVLQAKFR